MAQTQIQLANTFNEFRSAYNAAANTIDSLETSLNAITGGGGSGVNVGTVTANNFINNSLTDGRLLFANATGHIVGDADLSFAASNNHLLASNLLTGNGYFSSSLLAATVQANNLTSGRVTYATTNGQLTDDADFAFDSSTNRVTIANGQLALTGTTSFDSAGKVDVNNTLRAANVTANNLTSGRVLIAGTSGLITDDSGLTYNSGTDSLSASGSITATTWANAANMNITNTVTVGANVNVTDTVNALGHLHAGGVEDWITAKGEDRDIHLIAAVDDNDGPHDIAIVNRNNSANAYGEFIAMNNAGNTEQGWVSMGVNATNYNQGAFAITKGDDAYILYQAPVGTTESGDLVIGTGGNGTGNKIIFSANGFDDPANNTQLTIIPGQRVHIEIPTQSTSTSTGALTVAGGLGVVGNMNVGGNVTITGTISLLGSGNTVSTDTLAVANSMLFLANGNSSDSLDIGVIGQYQQGSPKYFGLVRDQSDGVFKLFLDATTRPANTVNFAEAGLNYGSVQIGELYTSNTTASSSTSTGALRTGGGLGVAGNINAGGYIKTTDSTATTSTSSGALIVAGGAGIAGNTHIGGYLRTTDTTASITTGTGALIVAGGAGIGGAINTGGVINVGDATDSTTTSSGSIVTNGGIGAAKNVFVGGTIATTNTTASTSTSTGALRSAGGLGVAGAVFAGGAIRTNSTTTSTSTTTGSIIADGGVGIAGTLVVGGLVTTQNATEVTGDISASGVTTFDTAAVNVFRVSPSANFTVNFTNVDTTSSRSKVYTLIVAQGATPRTLSAVQIGGVSQTITYAGNITPTAAANKTEVYVFTLLRSSGGTWTVLGQMASYG